MIGENFLSNVSTFSSETYQIWATKFWAYLIVNDLWDVMETGYVSASFEESIDTQIRSHRVAIKQRSKPNIHVAILNAIFTRIMV